MPRSAEAVRVRLQQAAVELFDERGYDATTAEDIAARAGVTQRTFFRHFTDKREIFFAGETRLLDSLLASVAAAPVGRKPLPVLLAAFHDAVPLLESNRPVTEPRQRIMAVTPALRERSLAKSAGIVAALTDALRERGVEARTAQICAQIGMDAFGVATAWWFEKRRQDLHALLDEAFAELRAAVRTLR